MKKLLDQLKNKIMGTAACKFKVGDAIKVVRKNYSSSPNVGIQGDIKNISPSSTQGRRHLHYITFASKDGVTRNAYSDEIELILTRKEQLIIQKKELLDRKKTISESIKEIQATLDIMEKHGIDEMTPELEKVYLVANELEELNIDNDKAERIARILAK